MFPHVGRDHADIQAPIAVPGVSMGRSFRPMWRLDLLRELPVFVEQFGHPRSRRPGQCKKQVAEQRLVVLIVPQRFSACVDCVVSCPHEKQGAAEVPRRIRIGWVGAKRFSKEGDCIVQITLLLENPAVTGKQAGIAWRERQGAQRHRERRIEVAQAEKFADQQSLCRDVVGAVSSCGMQCCQGLVLESRDPEPQGDRKAVGIVTQVALGRGHHLSAEPTGGICFVRQ